MIVFITNYDSFEWGCSEFRNDNGLMHRLNSFKYLLINLLNPLNGARMRLGMKRIFLELVTGM